MYRAQILLAETTGPDGNGGMPSVVLPYECETPAIAAKTAQAVLRMMKRPAGTAFYNILDERGNPFYERMAEAAGQTISR